MHPEHQDCPLETLNEYTVDHIEHPDGPPDPNLPINEFLDSIRPLEWKAFERCDPPVVPDPSPISHRSATDGQLKPPSAAKLEPSEDVSGTRVVEEGTEVYFEREI